MGLQIHADLVSLVVPAPHRGVRAEKEHGNTADEQTNERNDKGNPPCLGRAEALMSDERVKDGGHDEVSNTTAGVTPTTSQGVGGADNVLVEEASAPHLARDKGSTQDTNEKSGNVETCGILHERSKADGETTEKDEGGVYSSRAKLVTKGSGDEAEEEGCAEGYNVGVGNLSRCKTEVFSDRDRQ